MAFLFFWGTQWNLVSWISELNCHMACLYICSHCYVIPFAI